MEAKFCRGKGAGPRLDNGRQRRREEGPGTSSRQCLRWISHGPAIASLQTFTAPCQAASRFLNKAARSRRADSVWRASAQRPAPPARSGCRARSPAPCAWRPPAGSPRIQCATRARDNRSRSALAFPFISALAFRRRAGMTRKPSAAISPAITIPVMSAAAVVTAARAPSAIAAASRCLS